MTVDHELVNALIGAYSQGHFPMADPESGAIGWYDPDPRGILPIVPGDPAGAFRVSKTLAQKVRQCQRGVGKFTITSDRAFGEVIRSCAKPRAEQGEDLTWIDERIVWGYEQLYEAGCAHSVEAWTKSEAKTGSEPILVGGLYGVAVGGMFAGESMFCRPDLGGTDASKVCLVYLVEHLRRQGFALLDTQFGNPHLEQFGCVEIPREDYKRRLGEALEKQVDWGRFDPDTIGP